MLHEIYRVAMPTTTPAKTLELLLRDLAGFEHTSQDPIARVLGRFFDVGVNDPEFYTILGAIHGRFGDLIALLNDLPELDDEPEERATIIATVKALTLTFQAECLTQQWHNSHSRYIATEHLVRLAHAHSLLKRRHSYELLTDE
jgi:hypothetical protein